MIFLAMLGICAGCQSLRGKLLGLDLSDGVSQAEAMVIAQCYSEEHLGSGKIDRIEDSGDHWTAVGKLGGYVAKPLSFAIEKQSGKITSQVGPSYDSPLDIYK